MKISICTSVFNDEKTLPLLYELINAQNSLIYEWIIALDGSQDGTLKLAEKYRKTALFTVKAVWQPHIGMRHAKNMNNAFKLATGDVILVVMGDSYLQPKTLQKIKYTFKEETVGSALRVNVDKEGNFHSYDWRVPQGGDAIIEVPTYEYMTGNGMIVWREDLKKSGYWDERYLGYGKMDWDSFHQLQKQGLKLVQYNNIKINHIYHGEGQPDSKENDLLFQSRL